MPRDAERDIVGIWRLRNSSYLVRRIRGVEVAGFESWTGRIRGVMTRILREGWDADFG